LIEEIQNKKPNWKKCMNTGTRINQIMSQIEEIESLFVN
jgi:hypothetical protein